MNNEQDLPSGLTVALIVHSVEHSLSAHLINRGPFSESRPADILVDCIRRHKQAQSVNPKDEQC